ncbi:hypothetical protein GBA52_015957 [Prunus armeniaca]|nr:hypothetical protein GBA52_015957 [Prunus armeniaca]
MLEFFWLGRRILVMSRSQCMDIRDGLACVAPKGWRKIMVEGDSKLVIDSVLKRCSVPWCIASARSRYLAFHV